MAAKSVVLVPGLSYGPSLFEFQTQHLTDLAPCRVVQVTDHRIDTFVDATLSAVDGQFALIAHSGATLGAIALAARAPDRLSHLILQGAMAKPLPPIADFLRGVISDIQGGKLDESRTAIRTPALGTGHPNQAEIERQVISSQHQVEAEDLVAQCQFIVDNMDQMSNLPKISTPTLFLHARNDGYFDLDLTSEIAGAVPGSQLVVVEDTGHLMALEQPAALTALVRLWLAADGVGTR